MPDAREEILRRVRAAVHDVPRDEDREAVRVARDYRRTIDEPTEVVLDRFVERVRDYRAQVRRVRRGELAFAVRGACDELNLRRLVVPVGLPEDWRAPDVELVDDRALDAATLDDLDGTLTGCAVAIAETGTIVLDGQGASGRRAITLVPDHHLCVVLEQQVVASVPEAIATLADAVSVQRTPITFVSGPSASSDIELSRVEGVHGPRHLLVLLVGD